MKPTTYLRYMARESRGSRGRLAFFVLCLAVGVAAVVAVAGLSNALERAVGAEARQLLAADLAIESSRPLPDDVLATLDGRAGLRRTDVRQLATVVAAISDDGTPGASQLVDLKAVGSGYPFYGELELEPDRRLAAVLDPMSTVVAPELATRLDLGIGDEIKVGYANFRIAAIVHSEPDRVRVGLTVGPRLFLSLAGLARADLERFGSRVRYRQLVATPEGTQTSELTALAEELRELGNGGARFRVQSYSEVQPNVRDGLRRVERFLGLVALLSLLLGGVGVAQTTRAWLGGRMDSIAILRSVGFRPRQVVFLYLGQACVLGLTGSLVGCALGTLVLTGAPALLADLLPQALELSAWQPWAVVRGVGLGLGTALLFSVGPLTATRRVPPLRVLRKDVEPIPPSRWGQAATYALIGGGIWIAAAVQARSLLLGAQFALGIAAAALVLTLAAHLVVRGVGRLPRGWGRIWVRHGLAALARPGAATTGAVVALGLGVVLLLAMALVEGGLRRQLTESLPRDSPSAFLVDIQPGQWAGVARRLASVGATNVDSAPVVTARLVSIDGQTVDDLSDTTDNRSRRWALTREQRLTYLDELAPDNEVIAGELWGDPDALELSVERDFARDLDVAVGSRLAFDIQGVVVELTVGSLRIVDWGSFAINFFLVAEPGSLDAAPQFRVATLRLPRDAEQGLQDHLTAEFPNVTMIRIRDLLDKVRAVLDRLALGIRLLGSFTIASGLVILAGAASASSVRRAKEIALLKTLGMTRGGIASMLAVEYALVGLLAGLLGAVGGVILAWSVLTRGMELDWAFDPSAPALAVGLSTLLTAATGLAAALPALQQRPIEILKGD